MAGRPLRRARAILNNPVPPGIMSGPRSLPTKPTWKRGKDGELHAEVRLHGELHVRLNIIRPSRRMLNVSTNVPEWFLEGVRILTVNVSPFYYISSREADYYRLPFTTYSLLYRLYQAIDYTELHSKVRFLWRVMPPKLSPEPEDGEDGEDGRDWDFPTPELDLFVTPLAFGRESVEKLENLPLLPQQEQQLKQAADILLHRFSNALADVPDIQLGAA